jgi:hypothetical protein
MSGTPLSRRDFLRLRRTEQGRVLEVSCRALYMRLADARLTAEPLAAEWEPWMGEPPAVLERRSTEDLLQTLERDLQDVQVLRLLEPEWLDALQEAPALAQMFAGFTARGGRVDPAGPA